MYNRGFKLYWQIAHKRFRLHDNLGYFRSYKTRHRVLQAIKDLDPAIGTGIWKVIDSYDNSVSIVNKLAHKETK